jgi:S1-C subfamily serine protease
MVSIDQLAGSSTESPSAARGVYDAFRSFSETSDANDIRYAARVSQGLRAAAVDGIASMRGAKDVQQYRQFSPSVALIATENSVGTGFVIGSDGSIVTNYHVVGDAPRVVVVFKPLVEGASPKKADAVVATVVKVDQVSDLALLKVEKIPQHVKPLELGSLATVEVGADVFAIGHPTGEAWTYTKGIVSQIRRDYKWKTESGITHSASIIQTQTPINPGNSGGPLIATTGQVLGVNSFKSSGEGLNYAVSVDDVRAFIARKSNRMVAATPRSSAARSGAASGRCESKLLKSFRGDDRKSERGLLDLDCDGNADAVMVLPDDQTKPVEIWIDNNKDGKVDLILVDEDRDGKMDYQVADTDLDGKGDVIGYYRNGERQPYKYERI